VSRRSPVLAGITWLYVAWSIAPVLIAVLFSFNRGRSRSAWQGFSLRWWLADEGSVRKSSEPHQAFTNSVVLAALTVVVAIPIGTALAIALARWRARPTRATEAVATLPFVTPELLVGSALLIVFTQLYDAVPLGRPAQLLGHVTFTLSYVVVTVGARMAGVSRALDDAARDLGASTWNAVRLVILPQLWPAIVAAVVIVFATSLDDFVISSFLAAPGDDTMPMVMYSQARGGATPAVNALATAMLVLTLAVAGGGLWLAQRLRTPAGR
jgi:spermidine/putrescine transport system permease protein